MTNLVVTPNVKRKTLKLEGRIAAGEHVLVRVETFDDKVGEGKSLRLRAVAQNGYTLAVFPPQVKDDDPPRPQEELVWQVDGGDATCVFDFNTVQAEKFLRCGGECLFVLDDVDNHTLYGNGFCTVAPWAKVAGLDAPVDLDGYKDVGERVTVLEGEIASIGEKADAASAQASSAKSTADSAAQVAETARTDSVAAGNAAISAASSASAAQTGAAAASSAAGAAAASASAAAASAKSASDKFDALSDVAKSGRYEDLLDKPSIPSIAGLATKTELSNEENRAKGVEQDILNRLSKTPSLDDGGKVPASQLPSYVDDVIEYGDRTRFPAFGDGGKIYVDMSTNHLYRWTGTVYVQIPAGLALGETAASAYPGNKGLENAQKIANLQASKQDKLDPSQLAAVNSGINAAKVADMVTKSDVVPVGDGTEVVARIGGKEIKIPSVGDPGSISDSAGNVINADGGVVVVDGSWSCNGIVLNRISDNEWENAEYGYGLGFLPGFGKWAFGLADGSGVAEVSAPSGSKKLAFQINGTTYNLTFGRADSLLTTSDVQPQGSGTVLIATIGGKQIKAPAGGGGGGSVVESEANPGYAANADAANSVPWSGVAGKPTSFDPSVHAATHAANGVDPVTPESIGALSKYGGRVDGNLVVTQVLTVADGALVAQRTGSGPSDVSVTKGDKEVATEDDVRDVSDKVDEIKETVSTDNRFLVGGGYSEPPADGSATTAAIQTRESEDAEWSDEVRLDKGYDAIQGTAMVKLDKSVQTVTVDGGTLEVIFPDSVDGTVRDLCLYVNNTNSTTECEMTFPDGTYYGADGWDAAAQKGGITGYYFSEIPGNGWRVSREELKQFTKGATS